MTVVIEEMLDFGRPITTQELRWAVQAARHDLSSRPIAAQPHRRNLCDIMEVTCDECGEALEFGYWFDADSWFRITLHSADQPLHNHVRNWLHQGIVIRTILPPHIEAIQRFTFWKELAMFKLALAEAVMAVDAPHASL